MAVPVITGLDKALSSIERQVYEAARFRAVARVNEVMDAAVAAWPVGPERHRQKHSRDLFRIVDKSNGKDRVHLVINNDARDANGVPYVFYIRSYWGTGWRQYPWQVHIRYPILKIGRHIAEKTARDPLRKG